jgi:hypothetical protein
MKGHRLGETGEVLITGTQDAVEARPLALTTLVENGLTDDEAAAWLAENPGRVTRGHIVPAGVDHWLGYSWFWKDGRGVGRVRAVVFG